MMSLVIGLICILSSCQNACKGRGGYLIPIGGQLKKYSFKPGSYWIYQDSASSIIDSQSVYYYTAQNHVSIGTVYGADAVGCTVYGDAFAMSLTSFWNGALHDSIFYGNTNGTSAGEIFVSYSTNPSQYYYQFSAVGDLTDTLNNFSVPGTTFPKVYSSNAGHNSVVYHVDNVGVVKWISNDTINGQHTWNLLRYHVINP